MPRGVRAQWVKTQQGKNPAHAGGADAVHADPGLGAVELGADEMATLLGWDEEVKAAQAQAYRDEVAASRRWQQE